MSERKIQRESGAGGEREEERERKKEETFPRLLQEAHSILAFSICAYLAALTVSSYQ